MAVDTASARAADAFRTASESSRSLAARGHLSEAHRVLSTQRQALVHAFAQHLDASIERDMQALEATKLQGANTQARHTNWSELALVEDAELELRVEIDRTANALVQTCGGALSGLDAMVGSLLGLQEPEPSRNPLRPGMVVEALMRSAEVVSPKTDVRDLVRSELSRQLVGPLRQAYEDTVEELQRTGVRPLAAAPRTVERSRGNTSFGSTRSGLGSLDAPQTGSGTGADSARTGLGGQGQPSRGVPTLGAVDPAVMNLIRTLAVGTLSNFGGLDEALAGAGAAVAPNLIQANREALHQAVTGGLDHLVIDVVSALFDQILADPKVPPQLARQIARLQLPVLRAALGDKTFFSSRRHPVRRFVNRIASVGSTIDDFETPDAKAVVALVAALVQEIVDGDFEYLEVYEQKLKALEERVAEMARAQVQENVGAVTLVRDREVDLRQQRRYAQQLQDGLQALEMPVFLRDFLANVWGHVLLRVGREHGEHSEPTQQMRVTARELFLSIQPKGAPEHRKRFLTGLPQLMKQLSQGIGLVGWPDAAKGEFFGQLLPAHAESLRGGALSTLQFNLLVKAVDTVFAAPFPPADGSAPTQAEPVGDAEAAAVFSPQEAAQIGLLQEEQVDWRVKVDIDLSEEPSVTVEELKVGGLPEPEALDPVSGAGLVNLLQVGMAYRIHVGDKWVKAKLNHVSPGRTYFVFTHGQPHTQTVSMTSRMVKRMCEGNRLRAFESSYLLERATARARRQLAELSTRRA